MSQDLEAEIFSETFSDDPQSFRKMLAGFKEYEVPMVIKKRAKSDKIRWQVMMTILKVDRIKVSKYCDKHGISLSDFTQKCWEEGMKRGLTK